MFNLTPDDPLKRDFAIGLTAIVLLSYTAIRAASLSMTHDEASTYLNYIDINLWTCYGNPACWGTANNHWLNSLLMQWSVHIFGAAEWAVRLPNLLGHFLYISGSALLIRSSTAKPLIATLGMVLINVNPYMLDFFSLARGYGLGLGCVMVSLYTAFAYLKQEKQCYLNITFSAAVFAVLSCFVYLPFLVALYLILPLVFFCCGAHRHDWRKWRKVMEFPVVIGIVLAALTFRPLLWLRESGEFHYGFQSVQNIFSAIIESSIYAQWYFTSKYTVLVTSILVGILLLVCVANAISLLLRPPPHPYRRQILFVLILFLTILLVLTGVHAVFKTLYPTERKALYFIPLSALLLYFTILDLRRYFRPGWYAMFTWLMLFVFAYHGVRSANFTKCREWAFDSSTKDAVLEVVDLKGHADSTTLGVHWIYHPAAYFYIETLALPLPVPTYEKALTKDMSMQFYYVREEDMASLEDDFELLKAMSGGVLMGKKAD